MHVRPHKPLWVVVDLYAMGRGVFSTARLGPARRLLLGVVLTLTGTALLFLPGPGTPLLLMGVMLLAGKARWARRLRWRMMRAYIRATRRSKNQRPR